MGTDLDARANLVRGLVAEVRPLFAGWPVEVQGAALAELLSLWIAGQHVIKGSAEATEMMREQVLEMHVGIVRQLIPVQVEIIREQMEKR